MELLLNTIVCSRMVAPIITLISATYKIHCPFGSGAFSVQFHFMLFLEVFSIPGLQNAFD